MYTGLFENDKPNGFGVRPVIWSFDFKVARTKEGYICPHQTLVTYTLSLNLVRVFAIELVSLSSLGGVHQFFLA